MVHVIFRIMPPPFGSKLSYGTQCSGVPKWDPNFGNPSYAENFVATMPTKFNRGAVSSVP